MIHPFFICSDSSSEEESSSDESSNSGASSIRNRSPHQPPSSGTDTSSDSEEEAGPEKKKRPQVEKEEETTGDETQKKSDGDATPKNSAGDEQTPKNSTGDGGVGPQPSTGEPTSENMDVNAEAARHHSSPTPTEGFITPGSFHDVPQNFHAFETPSTSQAVSSEGNAVENTQIPTLHHVNAPGPILSQAVHEHQGEYHMISF